MSGYGEFTYFFGDKYQGQFNDGKRDSRNSQVTYENGAVYTGGFVDDKGQVNFIKIKSLG